MLFKLICQECGKEYSVKSERDAKRSKHCSRICHNTAASRSSHAITTARARARRAHVVQPVEPNIRHIAIGTKAVSTVDLEDFEYLDAMTWNLHTGGYAVRNQKGDGTRFMHRLIIERSLNRRLNIHEWVDHKDHNKLNCRRTNLRLCNASTNGANMLRPGHNRSGYKGVSWSTQHRQWVAQTKINQQSVFIGLFHDPEQAALAYDAATVQLFGEFAKTNIL